MDLDDIVPAPHFRERHARTIAAPPAAVWSALEELRLDDLPVARALMGVRSIPARLLGTRPPHRDLSARLLDAVPVPVLDADPPRRLVAGGILRPWKLRGGAPPPVLDAAALRAFAEPGWVRVATAFTVTPEGDGCRVGTETRIAATDEVARRRFGRYWRLIGPFSSITRREMLAAIRRRAEA